MQTFFIGMTAVSAQSTAHEIVCSPQQEIAQLSDKILDLCVTNEKRTTGLESSLKDVQGQLEQVRQAKGQVQKAAVDRANLDAQPDRHFRRSLAGGDGRGGAGLRCGVARHAED